MGKGILPTSAPAGLGQILAGGWNTCGSEGRAREAYRFSQASFKPQVRVGILHAWAEAYVMAGGRIAVSTRKDPNPGM